MRLHRVDLHAYGRFKDVSLEFPADATDFHFVLGPNEAGKSTLLAAINDLFYGFPKSTPYSFLYDTSSLRIGAEISENGSSLRFNRRKGNKKTLLDDAGAPINDDALVPFIGADQSTFQRVYGLNHKTLEAGSMALLDSSGNAGQAIFSAAAGLSSLQAIQDRLEARAKEMYAPTRAGSRAYYQALERLEDAQRRLRDMTVASSRWNTISKEREEADRKVAELRQRIAGLRLKLERLQRIGRVAPLIQQLRRDRVDAALFKDALLLPEDSGIRVSVVETGMASQEAELALAEASIAKKLIERNALLLDENLASAEPEIKMLLDLKAKVHDFPRQIEKREIEVRNKAARVDQLCRSIGLAGESWQTVEKKIPSAIIRSELSALADEEVRISTTLDLATTRRDEIAAAVEAAEISLSSLPKPAGELSGLRKLLSRAGQLRASVRCSEIPDALVSPNPALDLMSALSPWQGTRQDLQAVTGPSAQVIQEFAEASSSLAAEVNAAKRRLREIESDLAVKRAEAEHLRSSERVVPLETLNNVRATRDAAWSFIREAQVTTAESEAALTRGIADADQVADSRFDTATRSAELEGLLRTIAGLEASKVDQQKIAEDLMLESDRLSADWWASTAGMKLGSAGPERVREWLSARARILTAWASHDDLVAGLHKEFTVIEAIREQILAELARLKVTLPEDPELVNLLTLADDLVASEMRLGIQIEERTGALATKRALLPPAIQRFDAAFDAHQKWLSAWAGKVVTCGLSTSLSVPSVKLALEAFREMDLELQGIRDIQERNISTMERDLKSFDAAAKASATKLSPSLAALPSMEIPARLHAVAASAINAARDYRRLSFEIAESEAQRDKAAAALVVLKEQIAPLMARAQVESVDALHEVIGQSSERRAAEQRVIDSARAVAAAGGGLALEELEAETEAEDLNLIGSQIRELTESIPALESERDTAVATATRAKQAYDSIDGQSGAAEADADIQVALAEMSESLEEYVRLSLSAKLLRWAVERYREEKQDPMLRRAGQLFERLTVGAFIGLAINYEGDSPAIVGRRSSGDLVRIDGMSDGSRDQLFLALRVAALESEIERGNPMPFIADDLLMTYDDARAHATFGVMFDLARKTQVIYLSHHEHLVEIARSAGHARMNVVRLSGGVPIREG